MHLKKRAWITILIIMILTIFGSLAFKISGYKFFVKADVPHGISVFFPEANRSEPLFDESWPYNERVDNVPVVVTNTGLVALKDVVLKLSVTEAHVSGDAYLTETNPSDFLNIDPTRFTVERLEPEAEKWFYFGARCKNPKGGTASISPDAIGYSVLNGRRVTNDINQGFHVECRKSGDN